jgi:phosphoglycerate dehydrogenase-like enzyme
MMKKTAYFINISREVSSDEEALVKILEERVIAGAALDVFTVEPLPSDSPLWEMPNVIISPHMSADSPYYMDRAMKCFCINLQNFVNGEKMLTEVNKQAGY